MRHKRNRKGFARVYIERDKVIINNQLSHSVGQLKLQSKDRKYYVTDVNQRGAKVYFDDSKQPLINIPNDSICVEVLSVGFTKDNTPTLTVSENGKPICYRLPAELFNWAFQCGFTCAWRNEYLSVKSYF